MINSRNNLQIFGLCHAFSPFELSDDDHLHRGQRQVLERVFMGHFPGGSQQPIPDFQKDP